MSCQSHYRRDSKLVLQLLALLSFRLENILGLAPDLVVVRESPVGSCELFLDLTLLAKGSLAQNRSCGDQQYQCGGHQIELAFGLRQIRFLRHAGIPARYFVTSWVTGPHLEPGFPDRLPICISSAWSVLLRRHWLRVTQNNRPVCHDSIDETRPYRLCQCREACRSGSHRIPPGPNTSDRLSSRSTSPGACSGGCNSVFPGCCHVRFRANTIGIATGTVVGSNDGYVSMPGPDFYSSAMPPLDSTYARPRSMTCTSSETPTMMLEGLRSR